MEKVYGQENITGLSSEEVLKRLAREGYNEIASQKKQSFISILVNVLREPMLLLLLGAGTIYLFLGEANDALMLLLFVVVVVGITFYQERRLRGRLRLYVICRAEGACDQGREAAEDCGREVVREDILILREGDRVPADAVVLFSSNLLVDESLLQESRLL